MISKKFILILCALLAFTATLLAIFSPSQPQSAAQHSGRAAASRLPVTGGMTPGAAGKLPPGRNETAEKPANTPVTTIDRRPVGQDLPADPAQNLHAYQQAAEQGDPEAQLQLGLLYEQGNGVARDQEEALNWFTLAAEQGNAAAQANLGDLFEFGDGIRSNKAAAHYYRLAARQGYRDAQLDLGRLYELGKGVPQDPVEAYRWYDLAARQGDATAARARERVSTRMSPAQIADLEGDATR